MAMDIVDVSCHLSLRGGGASIGRKQARKRRFEKQEKSLASTSLKEVIPGTNELPTTVVPIVREEFNTSKIKTVNTDTLYGTATRQANGEAQSKVRGIEPHGNEPRHQRFVVFVGNLPYSATDVSIQNHFASLKPTSIRHRYDKGSGKSKGFAFIEFSDYDHMMTCLERFHHSSFGDGKTSARLLNVELTAGGGGSKSKDRRLKLKAKNEKLKQQRERKIIGIKRTQKETVKLHECSDDQHNDQDVHPSRRARLASRGKTVPS